MVSRRRCCIPDILLAQAMRRSIQRDILIRRCFAQIARGETLVLPNLGMETVHHVHAADVAQAF